MPTSKSPSGVGKSGLRKHPPKKKGTQFGQKGAKFGGKATTGHKPTKSRTVPTRKTAKRTTKRY